ncbi:hypothetical protein RB151_008460 [Providencia rettgeri]|nr:hypothetical protein RB151_008460 [Providencia rettgeri]
MILLSFSQPYDQLSGLAGERNVATYRKPELTQPLTAKGQLRAGVGFTAVGGVTHCIVSGFISL